MPRGIDPIERRIDLVLSQLSVLRFSCCDELVQVVAIDLPLDRRLDVGRHAAATYAMPYRTDCPRMQRDRHGARRALAGCLDVGKLLLSHGASLTDTLLDDPSNGGSCCAHIESRSVTKRAFATAVAGSLAAATIVLAVVGMASQADSEPTSRTEVQVVPGTGNLGYVCVDGSAYYRQAGRWLWQTVADPICDGSPPPSTTTTFTTTTTTTTTTPPGGAGR